MAEEDTGFVFNNAVPLPFRIVLLVQLGIHLWYSMVWYCYKVHKMNVLSLLNLSYSPYKYSTEDHTNDTATAEYATTSSADFSENQVLLNGINSTIKKTLFINISGLLSFWVSLLFRETFPAIFKLVQSVLPAVLLANTLRCFFGSGNSMGQARIYTTMKRILVGDINSKTMRTNDILISDSLTSYAKVINDLGSFLWMTVVPTTSTYNVELEAMLLAFPSLIRMRQCWYEYRLTRQGLHFFNFVKYSTGLGPIVVNFLIKAKMAKIAEDSDISHQLNTLNKWWYICSAVSSTYLFIWDVRMDWGFGLFEPLFARKYRGYNALREPNMLVYKNYVAYYGVITIDFLLRFIWVWKMFVIKETEVQFRLTQRVGNFLFGYDYTSFGFVVLEVFELLRRWLWCFLKLESDLVKLQVSDDLTQAIPLATVKGAQ